MEDAISELYEMLPPLFGYLPYQKGLGYQPLSSDPTSLYRYNQVFASAQFNVLKQALWQAFLAGNTAMYKQVNLTVLPNARFGIVGGDVVNVLWIYNNMVGNWYSQLTPELRFELSIDFPQFGNFPNYDTVEQLNLSTRQVNLLAHLMTWNVASDANAQVVGSMFG